MTDWNWFFSALAQSTAAVVGLIGAFVFTRIVNNQTAFDATTQSLRDLKAGGKHLQDRAASRYIDWYNKRVRASAVKKVRAILAESEPPFNVEDIFSSLVVSPYDDEAEVRGVVEATITEYEPPRPSRSGFPDIAHLARSGTSVLRGYQIEDQVQEEREKIDELFADVRYHVERSKEALASIELQPYSSKMVSYSILLLGALFIIGVVYPLSFMPVAPGQEIAFKNLSVGAFFALLATFKGVLLLLVAVGVLVLLVVFFRINGGLRFSDTVISDTRELTTVDWYSPYFRGLQ